MRECGLHFPRGLALILDLGLEPVIADAKAVQPISGGDDRFNEALQTEITEKMLDIFVAGADLAADCFTRGFAREIETALFIENREGRIDSQIEAMLADQDSAEAVDCGNRRCGQHRNSLHPLPRLDVEGGANSIAN